MLTLILAAVLALIGFLLPSFGLAEKVILAIAGILIGFIIGEALTMGIKKLAKYANHTSNVVSSTYIIPFSDDEFVHIVAMPENQLAYVYHLTKDPSHYTYITSDNVEIIRYDGDPKKVDWEYNYNNPILEFMVGPKKSGTKFFIPTEYKH